MAQLIASTVILASGETVPTNSLRAYTLPFGKFKGLTLGEISSITRGVWKLRIDGAQQPTEYTAISDDDGIRYLDWLLGEGAKKHGGWLYNETYDMIAAYMRHPRLERQLALALAPKIDGDHQLLDSGKGCPLLEDIRPSGFQVADTYDHSPWRNHGPALWINTRPQPIDKDPSPWELRGYELNEDSQDETDGWQPSLTEEPSFDYHPPIEQPLNNFNVWTEGLDFLTRLSTIGDANTKEVADTQDVFGQVIPGAESTLNTLVLDIKKRFSLDGSWRHTVPQALRDSISREVQAAKSRLLKITSGEELIELRAQDLTDAMAELEMLDPNTMSVHSNLLLA